MSNRPISVGFHANGEDSTSVLSVVQVAGEKKPAEAGSSPA